MSATWFGVRGRTYYFAQNTLFLPVSLSQRNQCAMCETSAFMAKLLANEAIAQLQVVDNDLLEPLTKTYRMSWKNVKTRNDLESQNVRGFTNSSAVIEAEESQIGDLTTIADISKMAAKRCFYP